MRPFKQSRSFPYTHGFSNVYTSSLPECQYILPLTRMGSREGGNDKAYRISMFIAKTGLG